MKIRVCLAMLLMAGVVRAQEGGDPSVAPKPHGPVRISGGVIAGNLITKVQPVYPADAHASGVVVLHIIIGKDGHPENIQVISGLPILREPTIDAVRQWVYRPYLLNGEPTEVDTTVQLSVQYGAPAPPVSGVTGISRSGDAGVSSVGPEVQVAPHPGPVRVSGGVIAGLLQHKVPPVYPPIARGEVTGSVLLHAILGKDGHVKSLTVIAGPQMLQAAAIDCVKQWVYRPYLLNGEPTEVDTTMQVSFNWRDGLN